MTNDDIGQRDLFAKPMAPTTSRTTADRTARVTVYDRGFTGIGVGLLMVLDEGTLIRRHAIGCTPGFWSTAAFAALDRPAPTRCDAVVDDYGTLVEVSTWTR